MRKYRFKPAHLLWLGLIALGIFMLPAILSILNALRRGGEGLGDALTGVVDEGQRFLAAFGFGTDPYAIQALSCIAPNEASPWNENFWEYQGATFPENQIIDIWSKVRSMKDDSYGLLGYDFDTVLNIINSCGSKVEFSYFCYCWKISPDGETYDANAESFGHWLAHGWWVRMSNKDIVRLDEWIKKMPLGWD